MCTYHEKLSVSLIAADPACPVKGFQNILKIVWNLLVCQFCFLDKEEHSPGFAERALPYSSQ